MGFSSMEPDWALQVDIDMDTNIDIRWGDFLWVTKKNKILNIFLNRWVGTGNSVWRNTLDETQLEQEGKCARVGYAYDRSKMTWLACVICTQNVNNTLTRRQTY